MMRKYAFFTAFGLALSLGLTACGGSSQSTTDNTSGNTQTTTVASGPITAFGSIFVNGVEYNTDNASIYMEGKPADESQLRVGMMVRVLENANGHAQSVHFDDELEGIVLANNISAGQTAGTMDIMGQTVTITAQTVFESQVATISDVSQIVAGNIVEVSGFSDNNGTIVATRIEVKAVDLSSYLAIHPEGIELKGTVANHDSSTKTFTIGNLTISYAGAVLQDLPDGIANDMYVEVHSIEGIDQNNQLVASKVELKNDDSMGRHDDGDENDEYKFHGMIMEVTADSILVNNHTILITDETEYENGNRDNLQVGVMVDVEAYINDANELVAREVKFAEQHNNVELQGVIAAIDATGTNEGTITLEDGTVIIVTTGTIMDDDRDEGNMPNQHFNLSDLSQGDYIEVHAYDNGDGTYTAVKIERDDQP